MPKFQMPFFSGQSLLLSTTVRNDNYANILQNKMTGEENSGELNAIPKYCPSTIYIA